MYLVGSMRSSDSGVARPSAYLPLLVSLASLVLLAPRFLGVSVARSGLLMNTLIVLLRSCYLTGFNYYSITIALSFPRFKNFGSTINRYFDFDRLFTTHFFKRSFDVLRSQFPLKNRSKKGLLTVARPTEFKMGLDRFLIR